MPKGKFITLEGGEGVGKTTNVAFIKTFLESKNIPLIVTREPGGTPLAEKMRDLLLQKNAEPITPQAEMLLMFAARSQHINQIINPALNQGTWVLCDRFTDATYAYQGGGRHLSIEAIRWLESFVQDSLRPDLTLLLDLSVGIGLQRAKNRAGEMDRFESEKINFFHRVRDFYLQLATENPHRIKIINADKPLEAVQAAILETLEALLI